MGLAGFVVDLGWIRGRFGVVLALFFGPMTVFQDFLAFLGRLLGLRERFWLYFDDLWVNGDFGQVLTNCGWVWVGLGWIRGGLGSIWGSSGTFFWSYDHFSRFPSISRTAPRAERTILAVF